MNMEITNKTNTTSFSRPSLSLDEVIKMAADIYNKTSINPFNDDMLANILGHKSAKSGVYGRNKGALSHYGLIEKIAEGKHKGLLKFSDSYINYITELNPEKKYAQLEIFFDSPNINKLIKEWCPNLDLANKEILMMQVIRHKKVDKSIAEEVADNFLKSYEYLKSNKVISSEQIVDSSSFNDFKDTENKNYLPPVSVQSSPSEIKNKEEERKSHADITYPLSHNRSLIIKLPGDINDLNDSDLEDIQDILNLVLRKVIKQLKINNVEVDNPDNEI